MNSIRTSTLAILDRFLLTGHDPRVASLIRMAFSTLLLINMCVFWKDAQLWFTDDGVLQSSTAKVLAKPGNWSIFFVVDSSLLLAQLVIATIAILCILLFFGIYSRLSSAFIFILLTSLQHRNPLICDGEDTVFRLFAFFLIMLPCKIRWPWASIDPNSLPALSSQLWPLRLFQIQITLIYASNAWNKLQGETWQNGSALFQVSRMTDYFGRGIIPDWLFDLPWLLQICTWSVLLLEALLPILLWMPFTRRYAVILGILLHLGIELTMNLFLFEWIMIVGLLSFLKTDQWRWPFALQQNRRLVPSPQKPSRP